MSYGFALFDTAIGRCGLAWSAAGVVRLQLPEADDDATRARLVRGLDAAEAAPPAAMRQAMNSIRRLLTGEPVDLADVPLDLGGAPAFHRRIYALARSIPPGETRTYGQLAAEAGEPNAARAVGQAMGRNPVPIIVPCHRVLAAGGRPGGFSAYGGLATKRRLLAIEGAAAAGGPDLFGFG